MLDSYFEGVPNDTPSRSDREPLSIRDLVSGGAAFLTSTTGLQVLLLVGCVWAIGMALTGRVLWQLPLHRMLPSSVVPDVTASITLHPLLKIFVTPVLGFVVQIAKIGAVRCYAAGELDGLQTDIVGRNLSDVTVEAYCGGAMLTLVVILGLMPLAIPSILIWVLTVFFLQELAINDQGITEALSNSVSLTEGHRRAIFTLGALFFVLQAVVTGAAFVMLLYVSWVAYAAVSVIFGPALVVFSLGAVTEAWMQLDGPRTGDGSTPSEVTGRWEDDELVTDSDDSRNQNDSGAEWS